MKKIRLIHWNEGEFNKRAQFLRDLGYEILSGVRTGPELMRSLRNDPADFFVIDLSRIPSQGRDIAMAIRSHKTTCAVPLIFVGGEEEKVQRIRTLLPDACFTSWEQIQDALNHCMDHPSAAPVKTRSIFDGYAGKSLTAKLGIKPGFVVSLVNAPHDFKNKLSPLPQHAVIHDQLREGSELVVWFVRSVAELQSNIQSVAVSLKNGSLWIAWPKKAARFDTDLTQTKVRYLGLATGLVDFKICSMDETWSGLLFRWRKKAGS